MQTKIKLPSHKCCFQAGEKFCLNFALVRVPIDSENNCVPEQPNLVRCRKGHHCELNKPKLGAIEHFLNELPNMLLAIRIAPKRK